ncbi:MAG: STAS domain-containing protein [Chlorobiaceae bacterium]|nr:STAS domain-containing protein [Chlorobiaceae bacterium]NTV61690.1 STAS domain-containing protein [Chlorobiaceae bacterium]
MIIQTMKEGAGLVVTVSGRMDAVTAPEYEQKFEEMLSNGETDFVIDFEKLEYISSAGLRALLSTSKKIRNKNGKIHLANVCGNVREVFDISGFTGIFQVHGSVAEALAVIAG